MSVARTLYALQEVELALEAATGRLEEVSGLIGDRSGLAEAERGLLEARTRLGELQKLVGEEEGELASLEAKLKATERDLYGGTVTNPKELDGLRMEAESLRERRTRLEDRILALITDQEGAEQALAQAKEALGRREEAWRKEQEALVAEKEKLEGTLSELQGRRDKLLEEAPAGDLDTYGHLRPRKAGRAVALLEGGLCLACRVNVPSRIAQDARRGEPLVTCPSCGRILCFVS